MPGELMERWRRKERFILVRGAGGCGHLGTFSHLGSHRRRTGQHTPKKSCAQEGLMPSLRIRGGQVSVSLSLGRETLEQCQQVK